LARRTWGYVAAALHPPRRCETWKGPRPIRLRM